MSAMQWITVILELADLVKAWADAFSRSKRNPHTSRHAFQCAPQEATANGAGLQRCRRHRTAF
jgi:hypothetical protein